MKRNIRVEMTVGQAAAVCRMLDYAREHATEGRRGVCFGDKRKAGDVHDVLFGDVLASEGFGDRIEPNLRSRRPSIFGGTTT